MEADIQTVTLEKMKYAVSQHINPEFIAPGSIELDARYDHLARMMVFQMVATVAGKNMETKWHTYPADVWSHIRLAWFPHWLKQKFPPRMIHVELRADELYAHVAWPEGRPTITISKLETPYVWPGD
jgi:hypothetical protein